MKQLYHIKPIYKSFIWGGRELIDHFHIDTNMENIGTIYHVIAIPGQLDNIVRETQEPLSVFYRKNPQLFQCSEETFPVRMTTTANSGFQSYQLHPDDDYAKKHENERGKVSGAVALKASDSVSEWLFGNKARDREEFKRLVEDKDWENLFSKIKVKDGEFVHTPAGVIHGGYGKGTVSATFGTNGDITYRFYDNDRNDPQRPLHLEQVYDCANIPEVPIGAKAVEPVEENGLLIYHYYEKAGEYVAKRFIVKEKGSFSYPGFLFLTCVEGSGKIEDTAIGLGETLLVPAAFGEIHFEGAMDLIAVSYLEGGKNE